MSWLRRRRAMERGDCPHSCTAPLPTDEGKQARSLGVRCFIRVLSKILEEWCRGNDGVQKWEQVPGAWSASPGRRKVRRKTGDRGALFSKRLVFKAVLSSQKPCQQGEMLKGWLLTSRGGEGRLPYLSQAVVCWPWLHCFLASKSTFGSHCVHGSLLFVDVQFHFGECSRTWRL